MAPLAAKEGVAFVCCGHYRQPCIKEMATERGPVTYLNSIVPARVYGIGARPPSGGATFHEESARGGLEDLL